MTKLTIKTGTEEDFFKRGRQLAKTADRGEQLPDERIISFEDPADMMKLGYRIDCVLPPPTTIPGYAQRTHISG
jgi:hypothetical protein